MSDTVLVTGGFGLVGSATVRRLAADGRRVVATDLDTPANRKAAAELPAGVEARWADLTDPDQVQRLVSDVAPAGDHPPRRDHPAADLPQCQARAAGQRRGNGNGGARR